EHLLCLHVEVAGAHDGPVLVDGRLSGENDEIADPVAEGDVELVVSVRIGLDPLRILRSHGHWSLLPRSRHPPECQRTAPMKAAPATISTPATRSRRLITSVARPRISAESATAQRDCVAFSGATIETRPRSNARKMKP